jgi:hypothetical protein
MHCRLRSDAWKAQLARGEKAVIELTLGLLVVWAAYELGRYRGIRHLRKQLAADRAADQENLDHGS